MFKLRIFLTVVIFMLFSGNAFSHCQIPCGIYDDELRIRMISEDIDTIEKSIKSIEELSGQKEKDYNQLVRWINNKDYHAGHIQEIVSKYFLDQRIVPVEAADTNTFKVYAEQLHLLHQLSYYAMKSKQGLDLKNIRVMRALLENFSRSYFKK